MTTATKEKHKRLDSDLCSAINFHSIVKLNFIQMYANDYHAAVSAPINV